jgi:uncharacterized protein
MSRLRVAGAMEHNHWQCPKCDNRRFESGDFAATGRGWSKFFNIQNRAFTTVTCTKCKYTEIYRTDEKGLSSILDFLGN